MLSVAGWLEDLPTRAMANATPPRKPALSSSIEVSIRTCSTGRIRRRSRTSRRTVSTHSAKTRPRWQPVAQAVKPVNLTGCCPPN